MLALGYPGKQLREDTPSQPLLLGTSQALPYDSVDVNPSIEGSGYLLYLCNGSPSTPHTISSVSVRIDSLTPFSGRLLEWPACRAAYSRSFPGGGGCGGGFVSDEGLQANFPADAAQGAVVTAAQTRTSQINSESPGSPPYGPLPVQIAPGRAIAVNVGIKLPNPSGTYTFAVGLSVDGGAPAYSQPTRPALLAPVAQTWTGPACEAPAMQAQIPPSTNPPTYYICPESCAATPSGVEASGCVTASEVAPPGSVGASCSFGCAAAVAAGSAIVTVVP